MRVDGLIQEIQSHKWHNQCFLVVTKETKLLLYFWLFCFEQVNFIDRLSTQRPGDGDLANSTFPRILGGGWRALPSMGSALTNFEILGHLTDVLLMTIKQLIPFYSYPIPPLIVPLSGNLNLPPFSPVLKGGCWLQVPKTAHSVWKVQPPSDFRLITKSSIWWHILYSQSAAVFRLDGGTSRTPV